MQDHPVGIVGLGHVGCALRNALGPRFRVMGCDPAEAGSHDPAQLASACGVIFVCVPTPAGPDDRADLSMVTQAVGALEAGARRVGTAPLVVIRSTVLPGTTQALARQCPALHVVTCPEFLRQHAAACDLREATRIVVGLPQPAPPAHVLARLAPLWPVLSPGAQVVTVDAATAEFVKHATNAFLAMKVTFANQLADACQALGLDYDAVARVLALDARIGASHLDVPGHDGMPGFGGACLPKDVAALLAAVGPQLPLLAEAVRHNIRLRSPR